jgi:thiol:disulfide interchange protein
VTKGSIGRPAGSARIFATGACLAVSLLVLVGIAFAGTTPVAWSATVDREGVRPGEVVYVRVRAQIESSWHMYSMTTPPGGPKPTRFILDQLVGVSAEGKAFQPKPKRKFDDVFGVDTEVFEGTAEFIVPLRIGMDVPAGPLTVNGSTSFMVCDPRQCIPGTAPWTTTVTVAEGPARGEFLGVSVSGGYVEGTEVASKTVAPGPADVGPSAGASAPSPSGPVVLGGEQDVRRARSDGIFSFLLLAITVGFASLLTPCVFPMIPITVSYFTKTSAQTRGHGVAQAGLYALAIIATFTILGVVVALVFGATGVARFAANPWVNILLAAIFIGLALNLFGFFEIIVPQSVLTRLTQLSDRGGYLGTILMGFTFTLTSFTCTMPFVGTLLVTTSQGDWLWPLVGMLGYSTAFALPFFLLALFPQVMAAMPRAGGWMISVKVVMGFLELAAAVKFISNVDLVWGYQKITRELFLSIWIAIAFVTAFYLLGKIRLPHERPLEVVGVGRMLVSTFFLSIAFYLFTGLVGTPLGELDAFLPPISAAQSRGNAVSGGGERELAWESDYDAALVRARKEQRPIFIDFTGYACTNCRWMETNVFPVPEVRSELEKFVRVQLYTDGQGAVYDRNREFQESRFNTVALPLYVLVDPANERETSRFEGLTRNPTEFVEFLKSGQRTSVASNVDRP